MLESVELPVALQKINNSIFYNCDALISITIPYGVTSIGSSAFYDCDALETVDMANSVTSLGSSAFKHCDVLKNVKLSRNLTTIPSNAFRECAELEEIVIPYFATKIDANAFNSSPKLKKVVTHEKLANINTSAFSYADRTIFYGPTGSYTETWCTDNGYSFQENTAATTKVTAAESSVTIPKGKTYMLDFDIDPIDFHEVITAKSSNTAVAIVDETGKITAVAPGTTTIKIIVGNASASCKVTVTQGVTKITLNKTKLSLDVPETYQLTATITPSDASNKSLIWTSSNIAAATVDANGLVTAVGNGTAVIKAEATDGTGISASCTVTVVDPSKIPVSSITLDKATLSLEAMEVYQLTAAISPNNAANKALIWTSSNEAVATVDSNGQVTAIAKGTATITATAADGYGASASCTVTVTNNGYVVTALDQFQSSHPYENSCSDFWSYTKPGAGSLSITFDAATEMEDGFDYLYIYDGDGNLIGQYTGTELAGQTITIHGDTVKVQIGSDDTGNAWGFRVTDVDYTDHTHSFTKYVSDGNATCTEDGTKTAKCDHCEVTDTIPNVGSALGHDMDSWETTIPATCTENGEERRNCSRCDHSESREIAAVGHSWDKGIVTKEPTEDTEGERLYTCTACGATKTVSIPVIGHEHRYEAAVTDPTCTEQGYTTYTCKCGESYIADYVAALGHSFGDWIVIQEPSTTEDGFEERSCTRCGYTEERIIKIISDDRTDHFSDEEWELLKLVNQERRNKGLHPLTGFPLLQQVAHIRSAELSELPEHTRPDGSDCFTAYDEVGLVRWSAGENIAGGQYSPEEAMDDWMNSSGHRENIMHKDFVSVGVGYHFDPDSEYEQYWVQNFRGYSDNFTSYQVVMPNGNKFSAETEFDDMDIYLLLENPDDGFVHYLPLTQELVSITAANDTMTVTFDLLGLSGSFTVVLESIANPFTDVAEGSFFYEPVMWAIENGVTNGTSATTFGPNDQCMRAHVVTFLWRAVGCPEPTKTDNPFVDVKSTDFYYKPVLWAVENGITSGMDATHFGPTAYCNRAQVVAFLYRTVSSPTVDASQNPFTDVPAGQWFTAPVLWAVENGITNGLSATTFGPNTICNRAQIVTFLYRAFVD